MEIYVVTNKAVMIGNVSYTPGSHIPMKDAVKSGVVTKEQIAKAAGVSDGNIAPKKASAPKRRTRAQTPQHQSRSMGAASPARKK